MSASADQTEAGDVASSSSPQPSHGEAERLLLRRGSTVGRYLVLERIGAGGMGVVYAAYDPELDRRVALKLLHPRRAAADGKGHARLLREAQAMARLRHPNVITVHDVGALDAPPAEGGQPDIPLVFVAMELVEGPTLKQWCDQGHGDWREVVALLVQAGRGLAAAHAAGLVHRDFKPENVLVGRDGRVVVTDFGLAREVDGVSSEPRTDDPSGGLPVEPADAANSSSAAWREQLTRTGGLAGTPAYMAPEQHRHAAVDARADQFAFCVVLYEALYGERPFVADTPGALVGAVTRGEVRSAPTGSRVPAWIRRILVRGLQPDADARWSGMEPLLAALLDDPAARRRRLGALAVGASAVALALVGGFALSGRVDPPAEPCTTAEQEIASVWTNARAADVRAALLATRVPYAAELAVQVGAHLDAYAQDWAEAHTDACMATQVRREQSQNLFDRRMACLSQRRAALDAVASLLEDADAEVVERAAQMVAQLPRLGRCSDIDALIAGVAPPEEPDVAAAVVDLQGDIAEIEVLHNAGRGADALRRADEGLATAERVGWAPAVADVRLARASIRDRAGDAAGAVTDGAAAYYEAVAVGDASLAAGAATMLVRVYGLRLAEFDHAEQWIPHARAWVQRVGVGGEAEARLRTAIGSTRFRQGRLDEALAELDVRAAIDDRLYGPEHYTLASSLTLIGAVQYELGRYDAAVASHRRALSILEHELGTDHPLVVDALANLGGMLYTVDRNAEALEVLERGLAIYDASGEPDQPSIAPLLNNLAGVLAAQERCTEALPHFARARGVLVAQFGEEHPDVASILGNEGTCLSKVGRSAEGLAAIERATAIRERVLGPDHLDVAESRYEQGGVLRDLGRLAEARDQLEQALALLERVQGPEHPNVAIYLGELARIALADKRFADARAALERAVPVAQRTLGREHGDTKLLEALAVEARAAR